MKKNRMMRIASCLLVAVLLTTCAISGTFAKYVTQASATSTARVAKWGVIVSAEGDAFQSTYAAIDPTLTDVSGEAIANSVTLSGGTTDQKLVAPGTSGTLVACKLTGEPEVAVKVSFKLESLQLENWKYTPGEEATAVDYCPIIFTVDGKQYYIGAKIADGEGEKTISDVSGLIDAVTAAVNAFSANYQPNTDLSTIASAFTLSWAWQFDSDSEAFVSANGQDDSKDTALGNLETAPTISFEMTVTVTQID